MLPDRGPNPLREMTGHVCEPDSFRLAGITDYPTYHFVFSYFSRISFATFAS